MGNRILFISIATTLIDILNIAGTLNNTILQFLDNKSLIKCLKTYIMIIISFLQTSKIFF